MLAHKRGHLWSSTGLIPWSSAFYHRGSELFESLAAGKQTVLNVIKTNAVVMGSRPKLEQMISDEVTEQLCFFINGTQIGTGKNTKCLGFQLDSHLVWD